MAAEPAAPRRRTASRRVLGIDRWLDRWLPLIAERAGDAPVLEIGCGHGDDTAVLAAAGLRVVAFDLSALSVAAARLRVPSARIERQDYAITARPAKLCQSCDMRAYCDNKNWKFRNTDQ